MKWFFESRAAVSRIAVIGAGISGLQVADFLSSAGFQVEVFDRLSSCGGVWTENYVNLHTQTPSELMQLPTYPMDSGRKRQATLSRQSFNEYIQEYAHDRNLYRFLNLSHTVQRISYQDKKIELTINGINGTSLRLFDFVVIATGLFNEKKIPVLANESSFRGVVKHSCELTDLSLVEGKHVIVVGYGKSANDVAGEVSMQAKTTTLVYRRLNWSIPYYLGGNKKRRFDRIITNPFLLRLLIDRLPATQTPFERFWHRDNNFAKSFIWRHVERIIDHQYNLSQFGIRPQSTIENDILKYGVYIASEKFFEGVKRGRINLVNGEIEKIHQDFIEVTGGGRIDCDLICFATGYERSLSPLKDIMHSKDIPHPDELILHRSIIDRRLPNIGFIGQITTITSPLTYAIQALWLTFFLQGRLDFERLADSTPIKEFEDATSRFRSKHGITAGRRNNNVSPVFYHKVLLNDMGVGINQLSPFRSLQFDDYLPIFRAALNSVTTA